MADDASQLPLEGLAALRKALEVTGRLATREELEEEPVDETSSESEAPEEIEAPKNADFVPYIPVSCLPTWRYFTKLTIRKALPSSPPKKSHRRGLPRKYRRDEKGRPIRINEDGTLIPKSRYEWRSGRKGQKKDDDAGKNEKQKEERKADETYDLPG